MDNPLIAEYAARWRKEGLTEAQIKQHIDRARAGLDLSWTERLQRENQIVQIDLAKKRLALHKRLANACGYRVEPFPERGKWIIFSDDFLNHWVEETESEAWTTIFKNTPDWLNDPDAALYHLPWPKETESVRFALDIHIEFGHGTHVSLEVYRKWVENGAPCELLDEEFEDESDNLALALCIVLDHYRRTYHVGR